MKLALIFGSLMLATAPVIAQTMAPEGADVYFISPQDGQEIEGQVQVVIGLTGMGVAPALVDWPNTGHHHILVNSEAPPSGMPIPKDEQHIHLGGGQTETQINLPAGEHTLQLVLGDHNHAPHLSPVLSKPIKIRVR